jgi:hypothetical protein
MIFAHTNLAVSAACMILSNHVKDEIQCVTDADCLLQPNNRNFYQCLRFPSRAPTYTSTRTKGASLGVGRCLVGVSPYKARSPSKNQKR